MRTEDGITYVDNDGVPTLGTRTIRLTHELWRTDTDSEPFFRNIKKVLYAPEAEEFFVLDDLSAVIHVYSAEGQILRSMDVKGDGPGKVFALADIQLLPDGRMGLLSPLGPKIVMITRHGDPIYDSLSEIEFYSDKQSVSSCYFFESVGHKYILAGEQSYHGSTFITVCNTNGYREVDLLDLAINSRPGEQIVDDNDDFLLAQKPWAVAQNRMVYISSERTGANHYTIMASDPLTGTTDLIITQPFSQRRRTSSELDASRASAFGGLSNYNEFVLSGWSVIIPEYAPDVISITEHSNGLWVETSRSRDSAAWTYDVFSLDGFFTEKAVVVCADGNSTKDDLYIFGSTVLVVKGSYDVMASGLDPDQDELQVICYERNDSFSPSDIGDGSQ